MPPINPQLYLQITHVNAVAIPFSKLQKRVWSWWLLLVRTIRGKIPVKLNTWHSVWY